MRIYYDADCALNLIRGKKIAIIGYGSQGHAHALNLRDSGVKDVRVGLPPDSASVARAKNAKLDVMTPSDAAAWADVVVMLTPDELQAEIYANDIAPNMKKGASLVFAHGFAVHFGFIVPRADMDVWMVAPKDIGPRVRAAFEQGEGVPSLVAVHQNASGNAMELALSYAAALGSGRVGIFETSFGHECEVDLFGEQAVLFGGLPPLMRAAFDTLVQAGYAPELAYFKCVQQVKLVADAIYHRGIAGLSSVISNTAEYGGYIAEDRIVNESTKQAMKELLANIQSGAFAREWMHESKNGAPTLNTHRRQTAEHPIEEVGAKLRGMMP